MASINKEQAGVGLSKFIFLIRKYSKSAELFCIVARVYFEIKSESISVSGGFAKLKEITVGEGVTLLLNSICEPFENKFVGEAIAHPLILGDLFLFSNAGVGNLENDSTFKVFMFGK